MRIWDGQFGGDTGVDADFDPPEWDGKFGGDTGVDADFDPDIYDEED